MADTTTVAGSGVDDVYAGRPEHQAAQKAAKQQDDEAQKASDKAADDLKKRVNKDDDGDQANSIVDSLTDRHDGEVKDEDQLGLLNSRTDITPAALNPISDDARIAVANRHENPDEVLAALRGGAPLSDYEDENGKPRTPSKSDSK